MKLCSKCQVNAPLSYNSRCRDCYNDYMREYMLARYRRRRAAALEQLGGECIDCGSVEELEFDHRVRENKTSNPSEIWNYSDGRFEEEIAKCVLRCRNCHIERTRLQLSVEHGGGASGKKNCKCEPCRHKFNKYMREWKKNKRAADAMAA